MHRFYLPPELTTGPALTLSEGEAHHALTVTRIRERERVVVLDGAGHELLCEVQRLDRSEVTLRVLQKNVLAPLPYRLSLVQAVIKGKMMDLIVQKATELGVHRIVPILSERCVPQIEEQSALGKLEKWRATTIEALKQCGSPWLPQIALPQTPRQFLESGERADLTLLASLQSGAVHPRVAVENFLAEQSRAPKTVSIWVGPEGDFTPAEINEIRQHGALPITLGQLILRSETAALYCLSVLNYELQAPRAPISQRSAAEGIAAK